MKNLVLIVLLAGVWGCQRQDVTGPSSTSRSIQGRVIEFETQTPLAGAVVQFAADQQAGDSRATTDVSGAYAMTLQDTGIFTVSVDGIVIGTARLTRPTYRGDLLVDRGNCISRYGTVVDSRTLRTVGGATVAIGTNTTISGPDGWYRIDLGCPSVPFFTNTVVITVTHPSFAEYQQIIGRGVQGVLRIDLPLERP
jgi:hypothetical protein